MEINVPEVLIVGGGVAGLATARALSAYGVTARVVERAGAGPRRGSGVYLPGNAVRAIGELGLAAQLAERSHEISRQRFLDHKGRTLVEIELVDVWGQADSCVSISHAALHELLAAGVRVDYDTTITALDDTGSSVVAAFDDGTRGEYDVVVGADGVHSQVRSISLTRGAPRFLRQVSWRFVVTDTVDLEAWTVLIGERATFLAIPLGSGRTYCYAAVDRRTSTDPLDDPSLLAGFFNAFAEPVPSLLAARAPERPYFSPIEEVVLPRWVRGRVALIGDAAHAMSPNMAEGVGMAVEDAVVLAEVIATGKPLEEFEARRRPRVDFVQKQTHHRDRTRNLPAFVRDPLLRGFGKPIFRGNYHRLTTAP